MRLGIGLTLALFLPPGHLAAQWRIGADVTATWFSGTSRDTSAGSDNESFRPYRPTTIGLTVERRLGTAAVGLRFAYASVTLADEGDGGVVGIKDFMNWYGTALDLSYRFARTSTGVEFHAHAGPVLDLWKVTGDYDMRARWGAHAGVSVAFPFGRRLAGAVRVGGAVTPSVFKPGELPEDFERRTMKRVTVGLGVRYGL